MLHFILANLQLQILMKQEKIRFIPKDKTLFAQVLRKRVDAYFTENNISPYANGAMVLKTVILLSAYLVPFAVLMIFMPGTWVALGLYFIMGLALAGIGMSVMHDANHGAYSANPMVNQLVGYSLNILGGSAHNWKLQHNVLHHTYTNIDKYDDDIQDRAILKFSPHSQTKGFHKYQWFYSFFLYGLLTFYWVVAKDFVQYRNYKSRGVHNLSGAQNFFWLLRVTLMKLSYLAAFILLPLYVGMAWPLVVGGFLLMHFVAGFVLTVTFQLAHTLEETQHPLPNADGVIENDWAIHQMETTVNFAPKNKFLSWYVGGLNYQVEHHLFTRISHVHYPAIAPIVRQTAEEFGIAYKVNPTLWSAVQSHVRFLKTLGRMPDLNEALG